MQRLRKRLERILQTVSLMSFFKSIYYLLAPSGSKRYLFTHTILRRVLNFRYNYWIKHFDTYSEMDLQNFRERSIGMPFKPQFSIIMPVFNPPINFLDQAIQSVREQVYPYWELCIADDASTDPDVRKLIETYCHEDARIRAVFRDRNGHISAASNSALELSTGEYIALLDHDDKLHPLALYYVADQINNAPDSEVIYSDEDKLTSNGTRISPYFKSDFDYELLLSQNMVSHIGVYRSETVRQVGGFRIGFEGSQDYDLLLRVVEKISTHQIHHIPRVLYHWRITKQSVAISIDVKPYAIQAAKRALSEHLEHQNIRATVEPFRNFGYKIDYSLPNPAPVVELFLNPQAISTNFLASLRSLFENAYYAQFKVSLIISEDKFDITTIKDFEALNKSQFQIKDDKSQSINFDQMIKSSTADFIGIIDESCLAFSKGWLNKIMSFAVQPGIGAVSPKLLDKNRLIHSCGVILGVNEIADHLFNKVPNDTAVNYYYGWDSLDKGYSALPVGCIIVNHKYYSTVGGLNEGFTDQTPQMIDFSLKLKEAGLRNIVMPDVIVTVNQTNDSKDKSSHHKLVPDRSDRDYLMQQWKKWFDNDPAFNPNLTLHKGKPIVSKNPRLISSQN